MNRPDHVTSILINETPINLTQALGIGVFSREAFIYRVQNRGPGQLYRTRAVGRPTVGADQVWRYLPNEIFELTLVGSDAGPPEWVWAGPQGTTTIVLESIG